MREYTVSIVYDGFIGRWSVEGALHLHRIALYTAHFYADSEEEAAALFPVMREAADQAAEKWEMENIPWVYQSE